MFSSGWTPRARRRLNWKASQVRIAKMRDVVWAEWDVTFPSQWAVLTPHCCPWICLICIPVHMGEFSPHYHQFLRDFICFPNNSWTSLGSIPIPHLSGISADPSCCVTIWFLFSVEMVRGWQWSWWWWWWLVVMNSTGSHSIAKVGIELTATLLPQPLQLYATRLIQKMFLCTCVCV